MSRQPAKPNEPSIGSGPGTKGTGKGPCKSRRATAGWIAVSIGAFLLVLFISLIVAKTWFRSHQPIPTLEPTQAQAFLLVNYNSGRCLSVKNGSTKPGRRIVQGPTPDKAGARNDGS